jgi:hypothetical protein
VFDILLGAASTSMLPDRNTVFGGLYGGLSNLSIFSGFFTLIIPKLLLHIKGLVHFQWL